MPQTLAVGDHAPDFTVAKSDGAAVSLADFTGRKLVIFFFPKANTTGCTQETMAFSRLAAEFQRARTALLGVSPDPPKTQARFKAAHGLSLPLGCDPDHTMLKAYQVWAEKSMYGRSFMGVLRTTFLIDSDGRIGRIWHKVKVKGHAEEVLAAVALR
jgi:peroxiredoxin Q/BCP